MLDQVTNLLSNSLITQVSHIDSDISLQLGQNKLWIATPWRLEKGSTIVIGSDNLNEQLEHEDYKDDFQASLTFIKECLYESTITDVNYSDFNELVLGFNSGYTLRTFQACGDDAENFQLYIPGKRFLVYTDKVDLEKLHQFYKD